MECSITIQEFKDFFDRGQFTFGSSAPYVYPEVRDKDIISGTEEALSLFNPVIFPDEISCKQALLYLVAHFVQLDLDSSASKGQPKYIQTSRSVGGISESLHIPEWMKEGDFSYYASTTFGQKYLILCRPYLAGAVFTVSGATNP